MTGLLLVGVCSKSVFNRCVDQPSPGSVNGSAAAAHEEEEEEQEAVHEIDEERCHADILMASLCPPDMELGHRVTGSMGRLGHLSRPGHRVIILTRCETRVPCLLSTATRD